MNFSSHLIKWNLFDQMNLNENICFFGRNTNNFTAVNELFLSNKKINYWRFEVIYTFLYKISSSALDFIMNQSNHNGTTTTLFTIKYSN